MSKKIFQLIITCVLFLAACGSSENTPVKLEEKTTDSENFSIYYNPELIIASAEEFLKEKPITITSFIAERSAGGIHDYYSEGSYWWANPDDPNGPYIRKDGERNPSNFKEHKKALRNFCITVTTLTAAYRLTNDERYALHALKHLQAWFIDSDTKMNSNLLYAQAIKGISTGRGIGIIDTVRLIHVAMSVLFLEEKKILNTENLAGVKKWFNDYSEWLTTHPNGVDERDNDNNHSTWWGAQVAAYAQVAKRLDILEECQTQFKKQLSIQMSEEGSFPKELSRTKPFHYMNYNLRAWTSFALLASTPAENLWTYQSKNGTLQKAVDWAITFYNNPNTWMYSTDIEKELNPQRNDFLLFAYWGLDKKECLELWTKLHENKNTHDIGGAHLVLWESRILK